MLTIPITHNFVHRVLSNYSVPSIDKSEPDKPGCLISGNIRLECSNVPGQGNLHRTHVSEGEMAAWRAGSAMQWERRDHSEKKGKRDER